MYQAQEFEAAFELLASQSDRPSVDVLWRRARVLKELGEVAKGAGQPKECERLRREALRHASDALAADASCWAAHKWYAISLSAVNEYEGTKVTIENSVVVRDHFVQAAALNPTDATTRHALGLWYWEVASLSWTMRKMAAVIFASPPTGTVDEALAHFQMAEGISPGFYVRNRLMIARCHKAMRDAAAAKKWAALALEIQVCNEDDRTAAAEAQTLLAAL